MKNNFKFRVHKPRLEANSNQIEHRLSIYMIAPTVLIRALSNPSEDPEYKIRSMKNELKMELVRAILDGEWTIDE